MGKTPVDPEHRSRDKRGMAYPHGGEQDPGHGPDPVDGMAVWIYGYKIAAEVQGVRGAGSISDEDTEDRQ